MLTDYEQRLVDYWVNWKTGMPPFKGKELEEEKHTKTGLTKYERELVNYWTNWKTGMPPFDKNPEDYDEEKKKVKHTKKTKKEKPSSREIMEEIQFELGLTEEELDDLLIPEEECDDLDEY